MTAIENTLFLKTRFLRQFPSNLFEKYICKVCTAHQPLKASARRQVRSRQQLFHEETSTNDKNTFATDYSNKF